MQSALLESMAEKQVTIGDTTYRLKDPFLVLATQNPLEQEGTYPLPEAQMDRFMFKILVDYPNKAEELEIMNRMGMENTTPQVNAVISEENLLKAREMTDKVYVDESVKTYIVDIVAATRKPGEHGLGQLENMIQVGASPRGTLSLVKASKANAFIHGRGYVTAEDVKAVAYNVLRHRLILTFEAEAEEVVSDMVIRDIISEIEVP